MQVKNVGHRGEQFRRRRTSCKIFSTSGGRTTCSASARWSRTMFLSKDRPAIVIHIPPFIGPYTQDSRANDPRDLDVDAVCVTMLTLYLMALFGIMTRPACCKIHVRDLQEFMDWLHVISDPIVVKVFAQTSSVGIAIK